MDKYERSRNNKGQPFQTSQFVPPPSPYIPYRGNAFSIRLCDGWQDKTIYTISGPVTDGIQHNIIINLNPDVETDNLREYADGNIAALTNELKGCRLLHQGPIALVNGLPAYKAIFCWFPTEELRIYQEQIYILVGTTGYNLTASFTKKTRKTLGPQVERMMLSFSPSRPPNDKSPDSRF
jgi:hypothetical protein